MNTSEVAKLLGVSVSTIQRWIKQLELPMERNERGHYHFNSENIELLKRVHEQLQNGTLLQDITPLKGIKEKRKGKVIAAENNNAMEKLFSKIRELEIGLNGKADSVASYQLLQHRMEIEDLQEKIQKLTQKVDQLENQISSLSQPAKVEKPIVLDHGNVKRKKRNFVSSLFGF